MSKIVIVAAILMAAGLAALTCVPTVKGDCASAYVAPRKVVKRVVVKKVVPVFTKYVAVFPVLEFPTYSAVYVQPPALVQDVRGRPGPRPGPAPGPAPGLSPDTRAILDALRSLDARITKLEGGVVPKPPVAPPTTPLDPFNPGKQPQKAPPAKNALGLITAKCAACHDAKVSAKKGGGFDLVKDGALVKLNDRGARRVIALSYAGKMPPKDSGIAALTDEEVGAIIEFASVQ